ncbi:unnamed protein product [Fraxinus pennsylvanica]|uniref:Uncharacterized protein n=1 Tax=Fraxinus pennsylvanica TaxID=56036 RepID=A0AAD1ZDE6_9LAMI|nr:unnamed protein product [Fraxinus pennsylvanica]
MDTHNVLDKKESEKQISVDPISLKESGNVQLVMPLPLPPAKSKFLSYSLPNSASTSPRFVPKKKTRKNHGQVSPLSVNPLARQHSVALSNLERLRENHLRRSKSCGENRASQPSDELDLWLTKINDDYKAEPKLVHVVKNNISDDTIEEKFKCGALCLFIPGFSNKAKSVKSKKDQEEPHIVSKRVSLEKFECGSWTSSAIINGDDGDSSNLFFDLPVELMGCSTNGTDSPITAAFVFDKDRKGVLKNTTSSSQMQHGKSHESARHVRFSTSSPDSPTCITPRLVKAREDFNLFLEAQSA